MNVWAEFWKSYVLLTLLGLPFFFTAAALTHNQWVAYIWLSYQTVSFPLAAICTYYRVKS